MDEGSIHGLQVFGVLGHVVRQEPQELTEHRVVTLGGGDAGQHHFTTWADGVVDFVALAEPSRSARRTVSGTVVW